MGETLPVLCRTGEDGGWLTASCAGRCPIAFLAMDFRGTIPEDGLAGDWEATDITDGAAILQHEEGYVHDRREEMGGGLKKKN